MGRKPQQDGYEQHKQRAAEAQREQAAAGRDIGSIPPIANPERRRACEQSLRLFCETYAAAAFCNPTTGERWPWSDDHLEVMREIERAIKRQCLVAFALPRGSAKTSLCRAAVLWAAACGLVPYVFLIGANADKGEEGLEAIKTWSRCLALFAEDFPEVAIPAQALGGIANRASGQLCCGQPTWIRWDKDRVVLPVVPKPANLTWRKGKLAPSSGVVIGVSGLTGEGIRGSLFTHPDGRLVRPRLVLLDDPQNDESAASLPQNRRRFNLIRGAVLGMAAPGERISAVMPCTIIQRDDMAAQALDRAKNPAWRGIRRGILRSMPKHLDEWDKYFEVYRQCLAADEPDIAPANEYYLAHREILDEGAEASWPERKGAHEISAIQHAMNLRCEHGEEAWQAEYQNDPIDASASAGNPLKLTPDQVAEKLSRVPRGVVPLECDYLSAYVDVHGRLLYWVVSAWSANFGGGVIDYGTFPGQPLSYFTQEGAPRPMSIEFPDMDEDAVLLASLDRTVDGMLARVFAREDQRELRIGKLLVDVKWGEKNRLLRAWCRRHPQHGRLLHAAQGIGIGAASIPMADYRKDGAQPGLHWRNGPVKNGDIWISIDTNWWKSTTARKLLSPIGTAATWSLFGHDPAVHALFADHCCSEEPIEVTARSRTVNEWRLKPGRSDNHWWDCLVGSAVGGSMLGVQLPGIEMVASQRTRVSLSELQKARKARRS